MLKNLNPAQQAAVACTAGNLLIVAGAGSGKTRVITSRIRHLLDTQAGFPQSIIALTFTNKAAKEMRERIQVNPEQTPFIGTFHAYCLILLKRYGGQIGLSNFSIMDSDDQEKLVHDLIKRFAIKANARQLLYHFSAAKNAAATGEFYPLLEYDLQIKELLNKYELVKHQSNCLDFDDLIIKAVELLRQPEIRQQHQARVRHILVDEYQDTSIIQHQLLKLMALEQGATVVDSVCVVGDEDQSIYSWRGATVDNILQFPKEFPDVKIVKIEQNYRSASSILEAANLLIKNNQQRNPKQLWSEKIAKHRVLIVQTASGYQEADLVANLALLQHRLNFQKTVAVLYRTHFQSRTIEEALLKQSIPYQIIGGIQFYERKEIKDLLAYLKVIHNPRDRVSFSRIYNCPPRKLGEQFFEQFFGLWETEPFLNYFEVAEQLLNDKTALTNQKHANLKDLVQLLTKFSVNELPANTIRRLIDELDYFEYLKDTNTPEESQNRIDNVQELIRAAEHFESLGSGTIAAFLDEIALMQDKLAAQDANTPHIQLMTLHAAKGLEFDSVLLCGIEEGLIPSARSLNNSESIEEERRLLYVGITRAKEHLIISHARARNTYGQVNEQLPSRFMPELAPAVNLQLDITYLNQLQIQTILQQFLQNQKMDLDNFYASPKSSVKVPKPTNFSTKPATLDAVHKNWKLHQPVKHQTFGIGIIQKIEPRDDHAILTVKFRIGIKKLSDKFVEA